MSYPIRFNVNDWVRVRLTDLGRAIHRKRFRELNATLPITADFSYRPPNEDKDGWSDWQLHYLMQTFGPQMGCCSDLVFETEIEFLLSAAPMTDTNKAKDVD